jgi:hypothetical protein
VFQRSQAERAERFARDERLRQERMAAYSAFAGAVTELRRGVISLWFIRLRTSDDRADPELLGAYTESDRLGAAAAHARFRVQLLANEADLLALADAVFPPITAIRNAVDRAELARHEDRSEENLKVFIEAAGAQVR